MFRNGKEFSPTQDNDIGEGVKEWIKVGISSLKNNDLITCTAGHPFYVLNASSDRDTVIFEEYPEKNKYLSGSWIASKDLRIGDELLLSNGENAIISSIEVEHYDEPQTTYNFEVADFHTYYVGTEGVLVHNTCPKAAMRAAKRSENIPMGQSLDKVPLSLDDIESLKMIGENGRVYYAEVEFYGNKFIRNDFGGHLFKDGATMGSHFNAGIWYRDVGGKLVMNSNGSHFFYTGG